MVGKVKKKKTCPNCQKEYKQIGQHWRWNPEHRPNLSDNLREVTTGLLMGDGSLNRGNKNPRLEVSMVNKDFLEYLDGLFSSFSNGVSLSRTAEEAAKGNMERDTFPSKVVNVENYNDIYKWSTCGHPAFKEFSEWYGHVGKIWPESLKLTPVVLSYWYVCDGYYADKGTSDHMTIALSNEVENREKIDMYFEQEGFPRPNWKIYERSDGFIDAEIRWGVEASYELWNYMEGPLPGFEYKWPDEVAEGNLEKLLDRKEREALTGSGDNR